MITTIKNLSIDIHNNTLSLNNETFSFLNDKFDIVIYKECPYLYMFVCGYFTIQIDKKEMIIIDKSFQNGSPNQTSITLLNKNPKDKLILLSNGLSIKLIDNHVVLDFLGKKIFFTLF